MGVFAVVSALLGIQANKSEPAPVADKTCVIAFQNVKESLDPNVTDPEQLDRVNSSAIDERCGTEAQIRKAMGR